MTGSAEWDRHLFALAPRVAGLLTIILGCGPTGSQWAQQSAVPLSPHQEDAKNFIPRSESAASNTAPPARSTVTVKPSPKPEAPLGQTSNGATIHGEATGQTPTALSSANALGKFRNTFYNFPSASEYGGQLATIFDARCNAIARVPRTFHDRLCVQGSGQLSNGQTVSFAKRNCSCARTCPRTDQKICFQALAPKLFPWGRGAAGTAIIPLQSVAVDSDVIALGTALYIPAFVGLPLHLDGSGKHDGCFLAADRGIKVRGKHVDIFAGSEAMTRMYNRLVPSNRGVEVFINHPPCRGLEHGNGS